MAALFSLAQAAQAAAQAAATQAAAAVDAVLPPPPAMPRLLRRAPSFEEGGDEQWRDFEGLEAALAQSPSGRGKATGGLAGLAPDVVVVGAGPVGLWTAVNLKLLAPALSVLCVDKHASYQRGHVLRLPHSSLVCAVPEDRRVRALKAAVPEVVRTNEIEARFLRLALELGVDVRVHRVESVEALRAALPSARAVVGADGSHSLVRESLGGFHVNDTLQLIADVRYEVEGAGRALRPDQAYAALKLLPDGVLADEHISRARDGRTPQTLRLVGLDEEAFATLRASTFREPFRLHRDGDWERLHPRLRQSIGTWFNAKAMLAGERRVPGSGTVAGLRLSVYSAARFAESPAEGQLTCVVGDAACGVPFFRALTCGLWGAVRAAEMLARVLEGGDDAAAAAAHFQAQMRGHTDAEIQVARGKRVGLRVGGLFVAAQGHMPFQVVRFPAAVREALAGPVARLGPDGGAVPCARCGAPVRTDAPVPRGQCAHAGEWHGSLSDCGPKCALNLARTSAAQASQGQGVLRGHWTCCAAPEEGLPCRVSGSHVVP